MSDYSMTIKKFFTISLVTLLSACATKLSMLPLKDQPLIGDGDGLVLASLGYQTNDAKNMKYYLQTSNISLTIVPSSDADAKKFFVTNFSGWSNNDVVRRSSERARVLVGYRVKAGDYEIVEQYAKLASDIQNRNIMQKIIPPRKFSVIAGQITYLGAYEFQVTTGTNLFGTTVPYKGKIETFDEIEDDRTLLYKVRPELRQTPINNILRK